MRTPSAAFYAKSILLAVLTPLLTACIDLAATKSLARDPHHVFKSPAAVFVMRGGLGGIFSTGMNQLQKTLEYQYNVHTESTVWYHAYDLGVRIREQYGRPGLRGPIVLVGHSLGANDQIKVAQTLNRAGIPVELLMTVDAVSPIRVPPNVKKVLNIYKPSFVPMFSGQRIIAENAAVTRIENLNVDTVSGLSVNHFTIEKNAAIQKLMLDAVLQAIHYPSSPLKPAGR